MAGLFITASGTDVGKTVVTALLARQLRARGQTPDVLKPVLSGFDPATRATSDAGVLLSALDLPVTEAALDRMSPWRFRAPLSPDMAAAREGRTVRSEEHTSELQSLMRISYAVFCLKKNTRHTNTHTIQQL